ncbi:MAG: 4-alpha-glucanotransferase [Prevotella sp.]|nr:4-alpha-glucanotransferase [Prevotella sp.]
MKLKFSIRYRTAWGESLHVVLQLCSQDGTVKRYDHTMLTQDGELWTLETAALESRQHPLSHLCYVYQVENADGEVMRREWDAIPRLYHFDSSKDYIFSDQWRDLPLHAHLYTNAYVTMQRGRVGEEVEAVRLPLFRRTLFFRVSAPQLKPGQAVAVCGSHPSIGSWNTSRYQRMQYIGRNEWALTVNALGILLPLEYKYVIVDEQTQAFVQWEEGDNRTTGEAELQDGQVAVLYGESLRVCETTWRAAGVAVPVFSLRSEQSYGVGDFGDLRRFVDWAVLTGMRVVQLLPVNDTTLSHQWGDSYPYNITSAFALHPHYLDLEAAGILKSRQQMTQFHRRRRELNALAYSDYEAVDRVKGEYTRALFKERGRAVAEQSAYKQFVSDNADWLPQYAAFTGDDEAYVSFVQYLLHVQLKAAADYARENGVVLKGDLPIGVNRTSAETKNHLDLFNLDMQTGAPPDAFATRGQNWGFPTYNWKNEALVGWFRRRLQWMEQYFDALRIDHILGFFRIWEIPAGAVDGLLGHFAPALPMTAGEIEYFGLPFRKELYTRPFINDRLIDRLFGIHAQYVRDNFLVRKAYNLYDLKADYDTQRKVADAFAEQRDENSLWIRDGLMQLISDVLFVEDPHQPEMYHPRIGVIGEPVYEALGAEEKDAFARLYNNYYYQRHSMFWGRQALNRLPAVLGASRMLICGEDLGMLPDCVGPVLDQLRILTLEIQQMPKQQGFEFAHLDANPYRSVCTLTTHDMAPLRLWWQEQPERRQRYYITMLQKEGRAPEQLPAHLAEEMIARHLYCPSMLCILSLQDWLAMDGELRSKNPQDERINVPSDSHNRWKYRMHLTIEELLKAERYNQKVNTMITRSKR